jgi:hypothetical protein
VTVEPLDFDPDKAVSIDYVHRIADRYIRPFAEVTYWWTIDTVAQDSLTTEPQTFLYADNRFDWHTAGDQGVNVHWYKGDPQVAQNALGLAIDGLNRARRDTEVGALSAPIDIYLYGSAEDRQAALPSGTPLEEKARTLHDTGMILVALGPEPDNIPELLAILPHEVTHALLHEATQSKFESIPTWLSEGLATSIQYEYAPDPDAALLLRDAAREGNLIPLEDICAAFPDDRAGQRLAYAESAAIVDYIRSMHGRQALSHLISMYEDGANCRDGVQRALGIPIERLDTRWRETLAPPNRWSAFWKESGAWVVLFILFAALPLAFVLPSRDRAVPSKDDRL